MSKRGTLKDIAPPRFANANRRKTCQAQSQHANQRGFAFLLVYQPSMSIHRR